MSDLSMLVFCFRGHTFVVYLRTTKVHNNSVFKELTLHFLLQKSHLWNSPMPSDFQLLQIPPLPCPQNSIILNPPSPSEILQAIRGMVWIFSGIAQSKEEEKKQRRKNLYVHELCCFISKITIYFICFPDNTVVDSI